MSAAMAAGWSPTSRRRWLRSTASAAAPMRKEASAGSTNWVRTIATCSTSGQVASFLAGRRQLLEARHALGDRVKLLLVAGEDRDLRGAVLGGIVERADLEHHGRQSGSMRDQMRAAFGAEVAGHCIVEVAAGELFRLASGVGETADRHQHEHVGSAARDILALAAMALRLQHRLALGEVAYVAAVASAFQFHRLVLNASWWWMPRARACRWRR